MRTDDMILVSIDDHVVEPPDTFERHLPARFADRAPRIVRNAQGIDRWIFEGTETGSVGLNAVASWPKDEWGFDPVGFAEMRPGAYDIHQRVRDMDANGVLASMCFPTFAGFNGTHLAGQTDKELANAVVRAYNDWHIEEWCGAYPGRFIPLAIGPLYDFDRLIAEIHRTGALGFRAISLPEMPHGVGLPSLYTGEWDRVFEALCDEDMAICLHIGGSFGMLEHPEGAPMDHLIVLAPQLSAITAADLLISGTLRKFPDLKVALSEGGIGWIPFFLDRFDRHLKNQTWTGLRIGPRGQDATEVWRHNFLGCFITDPSALFLRDRIGIETIAWECDYPHSDSTWPLSPEVLMGELEAVGCTDEEIHKITWENASRFFRVDPFESVERAGATVGALRAGARDVDVTTTSKATYRRRYEERLTA
ncbi:MAG TPA: amidohydrolase family protein [Acidimicrobiales bacterium]|nr:amidohydrolase family protein [Acidimicrobiales bacterium]